MSEARAKERDELRRLATRMLELLAREEANDTKRAAEDEKPTDEDFIELRRARRRRGRHG